jgi:hypothetical protein
MLSYLLEKLIDDANASRIRGRREFRRRALAGPEPAPADPVVEHNISVRRFDDGRVFDRRGYEYVERADGWHRIGSPQGRWGRNTRT